MKKNKIFGLIGRNIEYSFSKKYFSKKFQKHNLRCEYLNYDIENIKTIKKILLNDDVSGLNVTIPFKEEVIGFIDEIDDIAASIGAINTIKISGKKTFGYNTDYIGFEKSLISLLDNKKPKNALILGSGGSSKAIKYVLEKLSINHRTVSREKGKTEFTYENLDETIISNSKIIINCSPVGTFPDLNICPNIPYQFLTKEHFLYDLVYNPTQTIFLKKGDDIGCKTKNGLEMLEIQADESWKIWNN